MPDPHQFLSAWLQDGANLWLAGHWSDLALERLHALILHLRPGAQPATRHVGGRGVRLRRGEASHVIHVGRN